MAPMSRGKVDKAFKVSKAKAQAKQTPSSSRHRFQSFSQRISDIKIKPARLDARLKAHDLPADGDSHFRHALDEWRDRNMSEVFCAFAQQIDPLCQSLPQLLHHQASIVELLMQSLEKANLFSLEPLLDLTVQLAYDVGPRFRPCFDHAVRVISSIAITRKEAEALDWAFSALAAIFRHLQRLLVRELSHVFVLMAPLLGKQRQRTFVTRFAAESMSFLVRKAAGSVRELDDLVETTIGEILSTDRSQQPQFQLSIMFMFSEAIRGVGSDVHSHGSALLASLVQAAIASRPEQSLLAHCPRHLLEGVLISLIHNTDAEGFSPLLHTIFHLTPITGSLLQDGQMIVGARLLLLVTGVRQGSRLSTSDAWKSVFGQLETYLKAVESMPQPRPEVISTVLEAVASSIQYCPQPYISGAQSLVALVQRPSWKSEFPWFCLLLNELGSERFEAMLSPAMEQSIGELVTNQEEQALLITSRIPQGKRLWQASAMLNNGFRDGIVKTFDQIAEEVVTKSALSPDKIAVALSYLDLDLEFPAEEMDSLLQALRKILNWALPVVQSGVTNATTDFALVGCLRFLAVSDRDLKFEGVDMMLLLETSREYRSSPGYLEALLRVLDSAERQHWPVPDSTTFINSLVEDLGSPSHCIRSMALQLLLRFAFKSTARQADTLLIMKDIEETPSNFENQRNLSMKVRKLGHTFSHETPPWLVKAVSAYCFGLLYIKLAPIHVDVHEVIEKLCSSESFQGHVVDRAVCWLQTDDTRTEVSPQPHQQSIAPETSRATDFECTNLAFVETRSAASREMMCNAKLYLHRNAVDRAYLEPLKRPEAPILALQMLKKLAWLAEKKSRYLVPVFLTWFGEKEYLEQNEANTESDDDTIPSLPSPSPEKEATASREEKKAMLKLFAAFTNPSVLYKSDQVFLRLLEMLRIGDVDFQRNALKAILSWRNPGVVPYEKNLLNLLDDARFRDELAVFLNVGEEVSVIRKEHSQQLLPILLRLLYGRAISHSGTKNRGGQDARRKAILLSLSRFDQPALQQFVGIALDPLDSLHLLLLTTPPRIDEEKLKAHKVSLRNQLGTLKMAAQIVDTLTDSMEHFGPQIMDVGLFCAVTCSKQLDNRQDGPEGQAVPIAQPNSLARAVRHEGLRCITKLFARCQPSILEPYRHVVKQEIVDPRLPRLPAETAQGVSGILRLLAVWASSEQTVQLLFEGSQDSVIGSLTDCLVERSVRSEVKVFIADGIIHKALDVINSFPAVTEASDPIRIARDQLRQNMAELCLARVSHVLGSSPEKEVLESCVNVLIAVSGFLTETASITQLCNTCIQLVNPATKKTSPRIKSKLLSLLHEYVPKITSSGEEDTKTLHSLVVTLSTLFSYFMDSKSRILLAALFEAIAKKLPILHRPSLLCRGLNSYSGSRLGEPDMEKRMDAFDALTASNGGEGHTSFTAFQWRPIVHNLIFLLRDQSEFSSTRMNATRGLHRFIAEAKAQEGDDGALEDLLTSELTPALIRGLRDPSELVRQEHLAALEEIIKHAETDFADLKCLADGEEPSFFASVLHIQQSQRLRALRRLANNSALITGASIARIILPLLETMLANSEEGSQAVTDEIIRAMEAVSTCLDWDRYRFLLLRMANEKSRFEHKQGLRVIGAVVSGLRNASRDEGKLSTLSKTIPEPQAIFEAVFRGATAKLLHFVHFKDDSAVDLRVLVAVTAVKMIMNFPPDEIRERLPPILMDTSHVLRSKAQEARDSARKAIADIAILAGPEYFEFIIKQLKASLSRGTQLHVLSYTVHSLLVSVSQKFKPGAIDSTIPDIVTIIVDDVLGNVAQEKEAEDFHSKMKEVRRSTLGFDTMELLASVITPEAVVRLIRPLQAEIARPNSKLDKIDELLRRLREGLRRNEEFSDRRTLILCFELLRDAQASEAGQVIAKRPSAYKTITFSLDLVRRVVDKHESLKTAENMQAFVNIAIQVLEEGEEQSRVAALKLLQSIIKIPLAQLDEHAGEMLKLAKQIMESEVSTASDLAQAAMRLCAAVLRERPNAVMKKSSFSQHLAYMLSRARPDLNEPGHSHERGRQVGAFNLLKSALGRGVLINEVYDIMDTVREVMITSTESEVRSSARAVYCRFVLDYFPEGGKAFEKQMAFLQKNLHFELSKGRISVMEVLDYLLKKTHKQPEVCQRLVARFWNGLLDLVVTDTSRESSDTAAALLKKLYAAADHDSTRAIKKQLLQFLDEHSPSLVQKAGCQGWRIWFESQDADDHDVANVLTRVEASIYSAEPTLKRSKLQVVEGALQLLVQLCGSAPKSALSRSLSSMWNLVMEAAAPASQPSVRLAAVQAVNALLVDAAKNATGQANGEAFSCSGGLIITGVQLAQIIENAGSTFREDGDESLTRQCAKSLGLIARMSPEKRCSQIMEQMSKALRLEGAGLKPKLASIALVSALSKEAEVASTQQALSTILLALSNIIDGHLAAPVGEEALRDEVVNAARVLFTDLREKVGTDDFVGTMQEVQSTIRERREERKAKRRIEAVARPEEAGRKRAKKAASKKAKRKERNELHAGRRRGF